MLPQGALCTMVSTTLAASIAYTFAQGLGRSFAQKMIDSEVGGGSEGKENDNMGQKVRFNGERGRCSRLRFSARM
jgi:hypothetical protein